MYISLNGRIITEEKAYIQINDRGFLLGDGLFETLKVQNEHIEFFDAHYNRLQISAKALSIPFLYGKDDLKNNCLSLIKKNNLKNRCVAARITLTRGIGLRGINFPENPIPTLLITVSAYQPPAQDNYVRAMITAIKRNPESPITKFKTLNYLEPILAREEAKSNGFDEGIMINTENNITECSVANIFFIKNKKVITPTIHDGILPGITRNHIIDICNSNGYPVIEKEISIAEALDADEAFQTNSLIGIQPISHINEKNYIIDLTKKVMELHKNSLLFEKN